MAEIDTIIESDIIKAEAKEKIMNEAKSYLSEIELQRLSNIFDEVASKFTFSRK